MMKKILLALLISGIFLLQLLVIYWFHVTYFEVNVVLYSAIADSLIASFNTVILLVIWKKSQIFSFFEKLQLAIIWLLVGYILAISVPTLIDRSLSFYILEKIQQRGGGIQLGKFEEVFVTEYVKEHRLVDVRLTEQQQSGTIKIENGCVKLTNRGELLATFSRVFRKNFLPKRRLMMGSYSDDLTDPFRYSVDYLDYKCH